MAWSTCCTQDTHFTYNLTLTCVHEITAAVEGTKYYILLCVCVCARVGGNVCVGVDAGRWRVLSRV